MNHIVNNKLSLEFGRSYVRIPLRKSPHIQNVDALEFTWANLIAPAECSYILGNPPFGGAKYQSDRQRQQVRRIANLGGSGGTLDYVTAWFITAAQYLGQSQARIGFVATSAPRSRSLRTAPPIARPRKPIKPGGPVLQMSVAKSPYGR